SEQENSDDEVVILEDDEDEEEEQMVSDNESQNYSSMFTDNIPEYLGIKIDKNNVHKLTGAVGDSQSIGTSYNFPITIGTGEDSITVPENELSVVPTKKIEMEKIYL
ncbi:10053_t:CDS:2, partial [Acaulospora colombiana]